MYSSVEHILNPKLRLARLGEGHTLKLPMMSNLIQHPWRASSPQNLACVYISTYMHIHI